MTSSTIAQAVALIDGLQAGCYRPAGMPHVGRHRLAPQAGRGAPAPQAGSNGPAPQAGSKNPAPEGSR